MNIRTMNLLLASCLILSMHVVSFAQTEAASGCRFSQLTRDMGSEAKGVGRGILRLPQNAIRPKNMAWEVPVAAATSLLITQADQPADRRIQSPSLESLAGRWSNVGLGLELGSGAVVYAAGCHNRSTYLRDTGFKALAAMGAAGTIDLGLKLAFDRQFPYSNQSQGKFWGGGRSFPSGHAATSFAFASVIAHRYPHNPWAKWGAYALAAGVSLSRYPAKKHYLSDILVGSTLGYVTGAYMASH